MKAKYTPLLVLAISGFTSVMAQTVFNEENATPGDYTCGEPNNGPTKSCPPCEESEDPSTSSEDTGPDTGDGQQGNTCPVDSPNGEVNTNTGGVESKTTDIAMPGATGDLPLSLSRFYQTRDTTANGDLMGHGRTYTHSHSWSMWASGSGGASRSILIPGGNTLQFAPYPGTIPFEGQTAVKYIPQAGFGERLYQVGDWYYLLMPGGERYAFERVTDSGGFTRYFPRNRRDNKGNIHTYDTDTAARITKVTDSIGNWIELTYAGVALDRKQNVPIATITTAPVVGWNEITVNTSQPFQWIQGISAPGLNFNMSELEFYRPGDNGGAPVKLSGTPYGNGPATSNSSNTFDKLFDGNTSTGFSFIRPSMGIAGLNLGAGNTSHLAKIRFFISSFNANRLNSYIGHQFVGRVSTPQIITVLSQVTTSAGETVNYLYDSYTDPSIQQEHLVLSAIDYEKDTNADGIDDITADAALTWTTSLQGYAPHVERMVEPRKTGTKPDLAFEYLPISMAPAKGMPFKVKEGSTGNAIYTIENKKTRRYKFSDGGIHTISNTGSNFLPGTSTDAAGKTTSYTWTASHFLATRTTAAGTTSYTHNYMGQPLTITHPSGLTETRAYDDQGRLLTKTHTAAGLPARTTTYTRASSGRITKITYPDGSFKDFSYNTHGLLTSVREQNGSFTIHTYDLTSGSPTAGLRLSTSRGRSSATATSGGETETFTWTGLNEPNGAPARLLKSSTDPRDRTTSYEYDPQGRLTRTTYPDNSFTQLAYDDWGNKIVEFDGSSTQFWTYDAYRRPLTHTNAAGGITSYDYGLNGASCTCYGAGAPTLITSPAGRKTRRFYDLKGRLTTEIKGFLTPDAAATSHTYDALGRRTSTTDPDGHITTYTHDPAGRVLTSSTLITDHPTLVTSSTYSPFGDTLTTTYPGNRTTTTVYDKMGRPVSITDPLGTLTTISYDLGGRRTAITQAAGTALARTTAFSHDVLDRLTTTTHPDSTTTSQTYHPGGSLATSTDELGRTTSQDTTLATWADSLGQTWTSFATTTTDPAGHTSTSYGPPMSFNGGTTRSVSPMGRVSESYSDELGRTTLTRTGLVTPASTLTADLTETVFTHDPDGLNLTSTTDPSGLNLTHTKTYDALGRLKTAKDPLLRTTEFFYDKRGNRVKTKLPDNREHLASYDALGRLHTTTDPKNQTLTYTYWQETSQTLTLKDAKNHTTTWTYNLRGQLLAKLYPNGDDHAYTYDTLGRMATHTTPKNETCTYTYDLRDRQTLANWNTTTPDTAKTYWANGLLKSIDNGVSKSDYAYSVKNELTSETQTLAGNTAKVVSHTYDADGLRLQMNSPSGSPVDYEWTAKAQLDVISRDGPPPLATYAYDKAGRLDTLTHENGIVQDLTYDAASQLQSRLHKQGAVTVSGHDYDYDSTGRRTDETFPGTSTPARTYGYDTADQVTSANYGSGQTDSYAYDLAANRSAATVAALGGTAISYNANSANQYTSITGMSASVHDANGNLTSQNGVTYTWDSENRLLSVSDGTTTNTFTYDAHHRRVTKRTAVSGTVTNKVHYLYDGWNVVEERSNTDTTPGFDLSTFALTFALTWGTDLSGSLQGAGGVGGLLMVEEISGTTTSAYHFQYDGNGNVSEITDHTGAKAATYRYDAFGNTLVATGSYAATNRYRFSTKPLDNEIANAQLYYYTNRYYSPRDGRWPSRDPIEENGGINLYGFVGNDGVNGKDYLGHRPLWKAVDVWIRHRGTRLGHIDPTGILTPFHASLEFYGNSVGIGPGTSHLSPVLTKNVVVSPDLDWTGSGWSPKSKRHMRLWIDPCCINEKWLKYSLEKYVKSIAGTSTGTYCILGKDCSHFPGHVVEEAMKTSRDYKTWLCAISSNWEFYDHTYNGI